MEVILADERLQVCEAATEGGAAVDGRRSEADDGETTGYDRRRQRRCCVCEFGRVGGIEPPQRRWRLRKREREGE